MACACVHALCKHYVNNVIFMRRKNIPGRARRLTGYGLVYGHEYGLQLNQTVRSAKGLVPRLWLRVVKSVYNQVISLGG